MMKQFNSIKRKIINRYLALTGWKAERKIIVFESDDWGSIRMASKDSFEYFKSKGYQVDQCPYNSNDSIESNKDLESLFNVLSQFKDFKGNHPIFSLNMIACNPDFAEIKNSNYENYYYEPFSETLKRYPNRDRVIELYKSAFSNGLISIGFHGREHLNITRWLKSLQEANPISIAAFEHKMFSVHHSGPSYGRYEFLDAFGGYGDKEIQSYNAIIRDGVNTLKKIFGVSPVSFMAPCYTWPPKLEYYLNGVGIKFIQGTHTQRVPKKFPEVSRKIHHLGQRNNLNQVYMIRNVLFEPTELRGKNPVDNALKEIDETFKSKLPAIISTHRLNYIGSINPSNRDINLTYLRQLLVKILNRHPTVEFLSSDQLGSIILQS